MIGIDNEEIIMSKIIYKGGSEERKQIMKVSVM
jgi:hypothetical protein